MHNGGPPDDLGIGIPAALHAADVVANLGQQAPTAIVDRKRARRALKSLFHARPASRARRSCIGGPGVVFNPLCGKDLTASAEEVCVSCGLHTHNTALRAVH